MKYFTKTFGCQMNFADSDEIGRHLKSRGFEATEDLVAAQMILVNTCTVRDLAEHKAMSFIGRLGEWKNGSFEKMIVVTGCAAERAKADIKRKFPFVDLILGAKDIDIFPQELDKKLSKSTFFNESINSSLSPILSIEEEQLLPRGEEEEAPSPVIQYVTIMRGCNYNCSYCIVPAVRGREKYRDIESILSDVRDRVKEGAKEIWLLGQTVNSYKPANPPQSDYDFSNLLRDVAQVSGIERIRFMSPHPYYVTPKLIQALAETPAAGDYIHLPVQSGSTAMLQKMKRNYTRESYLASIRALRKAMPAITISTDIIVGFPGETENEFNETLSLVEEAQFDSAYCFKYSPRPGTLSASWPDTVSEDEKEARVNKLLDMTGQLAAQRAQSLIGSTQQVLIEQDKGNGLWRGKTRGAWRVRLTDSSLKLGDIVQVKITGTHSRELHGELRTNY